MPLLGLKPRYPKTIDHCLGLLGLRELERMNILGFGYDLQKAVLLSSSLEPYLVTNEDIRGFFETPTFLNW